MDEPGHIRTFRPRELLQACSYVIDETTFVFHNARSSNPDHRTPCVNKSTQSIMFFSDYKIWKYIKDLIVLVLKLLIDVVKYA